MLSPIRISLAFVLIPLISCQPAGETSGADAQASTNSALSLATEGEQLLYTIGFTLSGQLGAFGLSEQELRVVRAGLEDGVLGHTAKVDYRALMPKVEQFQEYRRREVAAKERAAGRDLVAKAAAEAGAVVTDSGLVYREIQAGEGAHPKLGDTLRIHYHGTLADGRVFDSSVQRGQPAQFTLDRQISCWIEALPMMKVGSKVKITCPGSLAYGDRGAAPLVRPGAALTFEMELLGIVTAE